MSVLPNTSQCSGVMSGGIVWSSKRSVAMHKPTAQHAAKMLVNNTHSIIRCITLPNIVSKGTTRAGRTS